jgi:hypothetical protein
MNKLSLITATIAVASALGACSTPQPTQIERAMAKYEEAKAAVVAEEQETVRLAHDSARVAAATTVEYNPHRKISEYIAPKVYIAPGESKGAYLLRSYAKNDQILLAQLYIATILSDWAFFDTVYSEGTSADLVKISQNVGSCRRWGCTVQEDVGIDLSVEDLRRLSAKPETAFEVSGSHGSVVITVPGAYFRGFLHAMDQASG